LSRSSQVPFLNLIPHHVDLEDDLVTVFRAALETAAFIGGPWVEEFEREFAQFCDVTDAVGVGSGTDALRFALIASGVQPGDTVVTVPNTFIATVEAISQAGARPAFVDIDDRTYTIDPERLRHYLRSTCVTSADGRGVVDPRTGGRVTAVIPVHMYGQMADMDRILALAAENNLVVIEDACQAHGAEYWSSATGRRHRAGSLGRAAAFSFYPGKNLGACGEAGAITTNDHDVARTCRMLRDHGQSAKYHHEIEGYNGRLDAIQAGVLRVKLPLLVERNEQRRIRAKRYRMLLAGADLTLPPSPRWSRPVYHLFVVRVQNREEVQAALADEGIGTGIHYPVPLHLSPAYEHLGFREGDFPIAERAAREVLSLPMYPELSLDDQRRVAAALRRSVAPRESVA
jgi:dTDP-4-amino-4,6-dideoxygalactose transaminase